MKKAIFTIMSIMILGSVLISCNSEPSLQEYYVEKQESNNFISLDLPSSIITLNDDVTPEMKETMASIKKLNVLAFKIDSLNKDLAKNGLYDKLTQKMITAYADIRNNADHGNFKLVKKEDVDDMIKWVLRFVNENLQ